MAQPITSMTGKVRAFWSNHQQRKTVMWVIVAVSVLVVAFGAYTMAHAQWKYMDSADKLKKKQAEQAQFEQQFMVEENGQMQLDLSSATQTDQMMLVMFKRDEMKIKNDRVNAYNQRGSSLRVIGIGVIGLALAYTVKPERQREPVPGEEGEISPGPAEPPFDLSS